MSEEARYVRHDGPIHEWFSLSYSNYLTLPRSLLQEMPTAWQERLVALLREMEAVFEWTPTYEVRLRDKRGRWVADLLANYRHPDYDAIDACRWKEPPGE